MNHNTATAQLRQAGPGRQRLFTLESANAALVLVRKVVRDVVERYAELMKLRSEREELALKRNSPERLEELRVRIDAAVERLKRLHEELAGIGCELKDWVTGCVDFSAVHRGRRVWLCWRLDEPEVAYWHEWDADFFARRPVEPDFA
jgi:hypothetical protein